MGSSPCSAASCTRCTTWASVPNSTYKKSARIVGEVLGKYHPHGDAAVYDAMARMAQDFSMRTMLVDGQGNFGSVDGDPPAAMRYTEARLAPPALDILADINKNTVAFGPNFDDTLTEPTVLPAAIPNLLVNGATGIAVGMATSIPPHNLGEVVDALVYMLNHWDKLDDIDVEHLMEFVQGPDFPTGGVILQEAGEEGLEAAYGSGRGRVTVQAKTHTEEMKAGRNRIIVTELPYTVNKSSLIERIAELAREGHMDGLADLRDESDRRGMRIVIELTKTADTQSVLRESIQAHTDADHLRHQPAGAGGRRAAHADTQAGTARLSGSSPHGRQAPRPNSTSRRPGSGLTSWRAIRLPSSTWMRSSA